MDVVVVAGAVSFIERISPSRKKSGEINNVASQRAEREEIDTLKRERYPLVATGKGGTTFRDDHERNGDDVDSIDSSWSASASRLASIIRSRRVQKRLRLPPARDGASINTIA